MPPVFVTDRRDAIVLYAAYFIWLLPEVLYSFTKRPASNAKVDDRASGLVLRICIYLGILAGYGFAFAFRSFAIPWRREFVFGTGLFLIAAGVALRWYSVRVLGKYFTLRVAIQPGQTVVEDGPYHWIRHPSYSGALLTLLGFALVFTNWLSLIGVTAIVWIGYSYRVRVEEQTLLRALGGSYRQYMDRTKRFIPFLY
ncbi:MAG TPA: isoprenylcysteine carboxylmethyltransferase family protein [Anaerolineales bacterium]|nr:isoprenylcysteine carboxylmethyltransferase family protein [Anaerolineales bacterium]